MRIVQGPCWRLGVAALPIKAQVRSWRRGELTDREGRGGGNLEESRRKIKKVAEE
jgi:hypothetical protein